MLKNGDRRDEVLVFPHPQAGKVALTESETHLS